MLQPDDGVKADEWQAAEVRGRDGHTTDATTTLSQGQRDGRCSGRVSGEEGGLLLLHFRYGVVRMDWTLAGDEAELLRGARFGVGING